MPPPPPRRLFGKRGRYTDNDERERVRAKGIDTLKKAYAAGKAYNDIDNTRPLNETLNAEKDYDMLSRVRSLKHTRLSKGKGY